MNCSKTTAALSITAALILAACSSSSNSGDSTTTTTEAQGGGGHGGGHATGGACGTGVVVQQHVDLFSCGLTLDCEQMSNHINPEPQSALNCFAHQVLSTQPSVLDALSNPGPYLSEHERLIIPRGDGTALLQSRRRECLAWEHGPIPWEASSAHQICDLIIDPGLEAACNGGDESACYWAPWGYPTPAGGLTNCQDVADWTCADVAALVE